MKSWNDKQRVCPENPCAAQSRKEPLSSPPGCGAVPDGRVYEVRSLPGGLVLCPVPAAEEGIRESVCCRSPENHSVFEEEGAAWWKVWSVESLRRGKVAGCAAFPGIRTLLPGAGGRRVRRAIWDWCPGTIDAEEGLRVNSWNSTTNLSVATARLRRAGEDGGGGICLQRWIGLRKVQPRGRRARGPPKMGQY